jgi:N12 class adenine-specific DNA methylase
MGQDPLRIGQHWVERLFEQIRQEYQASVNIVQWEWQVVGNAYLICFRLKDKERVQFIPFDNQGFVKAYIEYSGDPDPINDELREYIEACIRGKYESLSKQA